MRENGGTHAWAAGQLGSRFGKKKMKSEDLGNSKILNLLSRPAGILMGSKLRQWIFDPVRTLHGAGIQPGQTVLEVGCGSGFFTVHAARLIGDEGSLVAMDVSSELLEQATRRVQAADLKNVRIVKRDALDTGLDSLSIDSVLLLGVIPFPLLPLSRLLPEMHRILKLKGTLAVWLFPPVVHFWVPKSILRSGLFAYQGKRNGVYNYSRCQVGQEERGAEQSLPADRKKRAR
jgi:demethylmenaquinone methyltransferase/2-methoxy-6-polyprenyl-1,4-benzoquinol methylase